MNDEQLPTTVRDTVSRMAAGWVEFRAAADRFPAGRMNEHLDETDPRSWTRKQMLAHVAAWHELTADRLSAFVASGERQNRPESENPDAFNARVARQAVGRTAGEVLQELDMSYSRLTRHVDRLTDAQLALHDRWAAQVIAGNSYDHYAEHMADLALPEPPPEEAGTPG
jgi:DinB superfamily